MTKNSEIFLIGYYKSNFNSLNKLIKLINLIKHQNKKIIIASHSPLPEDVIKEVTAYIYDCDNILLDCVNDVTTNYTFYTNLGDKNIVSPFISSGIYLDKSYVLAAIKNIMNGLALAKQLNYDIVHFLDYDAIPDFEELEENVNLIKNNQFDVILYNYPTNLKTNCVFIQVQTIHLNNKILPKWDEILWKEKFKKSGYLVERLMYDIYLDWFSLNRINIKPEIKHMFGDSVSFIENGFLESVIVDLEGIINIYINNRTKDNIKLLEIITPLNKIKTDLMCGHYRILELGLKKDITHIDIIEGYKIHKRWDISTEENYNKYVKPNKINYIR